MTEESLKTMIRVAFEDRKFDAFVRLINSNRIQLLNEKKYWKEQKPSYRRREYLKRLSIEIEMCQDFLNLASGILNKHMG